jgi:hypothetical protein
VGAQAADGIPARDPGRGGHALPRAPPLRRYGRHGEAYLFPKRAVPTRTTVAPSSTATS